MGVSPHVSVVIPVYNEEQVFPELLERLEKALEQTGRAYEVVFIDDGSSDRSLQMMREAAGRDSRIKVLSFSRNFGHQTAVTAGINHSDGDAVIVMDADLQDPPELVSDLLAKWEEGWEVVYAVRRHRKEGPLKRAAYWLSYRVLGRMSSIKIPLDSGDFGLMDRKVVDLLKAMPERNRFVRGLRCWTGFRQAPLEYERAARSAGETKYTFVKLLRLATDGLLSFSYSPLRLATSLGLVVSILALVYVVKVLIWHFCGWVDVQTPRGWTTTIIAILFLGGVQLVTIGILGEYIGRIYEEVKQRPLYVFKEKINLQEGQTDKDAGTGK